MKVLRVTALVTLQMVLFAPNQRYDARSDDPDRQ